LDFSLLQTEENFSLEPYFNAISDEFQGLGMTVSLRKKEKNGNSPIESAFLKSETLWEELVLVNVVEQLGIRSNRNVKIKIEIDRNPPQKFQTEEKLLLRPFSFYVKCFDLPSLFAGKMHALLFRKWKNRVKGRDWFDMEWYIRKGVRLNLEHFLQRAKDSGDWNENTISEAEFRELLQNRIKTTPIERVVQDVRPFVKNVQALNIWNAQYFLDLAAQLKVED
jgi:hypothetical protein